MTVQGDDNAVGHWDVELTDDKQGVKITMSRNASEAARSCLLSFSRSVVSSVTTALSRPGLLPGSHSRR